jgi:hypothetical protein
MVGLCWRSMRLPTSHRAVLLAAAAALGTSAFAQMRPQGGSMPRQRADEGRSRSVEDRLLPDPWRAWRQGLEQARGALMLSPAQPPAFDALLRERDEVQRFSATRVLRIVHGVHPSVSAQPDPDRDLRNEQAEAGDWADALKDLAQRWRALAVQLSPAQRGGRSTVLCPMCRQQPRNPLRSIAGPTATALHARRAGSCAKLARLRVGRSGRARSPPYEQRSFHFPSSHRVARRCRSGCAGRALRQPGAGAFHRAPALGFPPGGGTDANARLLAER